MRPDRRTALIAAAVGVLLAAGCTDHPAAPGSLAGIYHYTAYTAADSAAVAGTITLIESEPAVLTGRWALGAVDPGANVGPQTGAGTLRGSGAPGVTIDLNPGWADNNVFLEGTASGRVISGTWQWTTLTGPAAGGRFVMTRW
jgi:hypothetical protein